MPRLWTETIDSHRDAVRTAVLDAAGALVAEHGLHGVTMSALAARSGIGRATLYKYFGDTAAVLAAWHERLVDAHLAELTTLAAAPGPPAERLQRTVTRLAELRQAAARHAHGPHAADLHAAGHTAAAQHKLRALLAEQIAAAPTRRDLAPEALAGYCLHALGAAAEQSTAAGARRLAEVIVGGTADPAAPGTLLRRG